ncbi:hypothetical protein F383_25589 [Gossypium arboreum]|uniref:Uncharacterized protein n=1 Tax=Gossypium arboreum TaxID=29729 RepID=A0A0B0MU29_GOSAR|nr:hypothetical protein F383_25589 [Gossypium arboreum]
MRILPGDHRTASAAKISAPMEAQRSVVRPEITAH